MHCFFSNCFFQILGLHIISELKTLVNKMMPSGILKPTPLIFNYQPHKCWVPNLGFSFSRVIQRQSPLLYYFSSDELNSFLGYAYLRVSKQNCRKFLMQTHWGFALFCFCKSKIIFSFCWFLILGHISQFHETIYKHSLFNKIFKSP